MSTYTKVLIADPIVLNNSNPDVYTSKVTPEKIVTDMGGVFVEGRILNGATFPEGKTVYSYQPNLTPAEIDAELNKGGYEGVIVAAKKVTSPNVKYAVRIGAGTNNVEEVGKAGGVVMNTPGFNSTPTANAIVYALNQVMVADLKKPLVLDRKNPTDLYTQTSDVLTGHPRSSSNDLSAYYHGETLRHEVGEPSPKHVAIIGAGHIGGEVRKMLEVDGHTVITYSRSNTAQASSPVEAARGADVIIVQTPLTDATRGIINEEVIYAANSGVIVVNAARAEVVDIAALKKALMNLQVGGIIADVDYFPDKKDSPMQPYIDLVREAVVMGILKMNDPRVILTPHTFADTHSPSREAGAMQAIFQMQHAITKKPEDPFINHVNRGDQPTLVQDGLKPDTLSEAVAAATTGKNLPAIHGIAKSAQTQR